MKRYSDPNRYVYTENSSKNRSGGLAQMRVSNKVVPIHAVPEAGSRCHVHVLNVYYSKLPPEASKRDNFYLQPVTKLPVDARKPWFSIVPVGRNTLAKMVREMCTDGEISGHKTNHSLRATGASELFHAGVPEKVIQQRTGHLSLQGLRQYERVTENQQQAVANVLASCESTTFERAVDQGVVRHSVGMVSPPQPSPVAFAPQMSFSGCSVNIYQGQVPVPPTPPAFASRHRVGVHVT